MMNVTIKQCRQRCCRQSGTVTNIAAINGHDITQMTRLYQLDGTAQTHGVLAYAASNVVLSIDTHIHIKRPVQ